MLEAVTRAPDRDEQRRTEERRDEREREVMSLVTAGPMNKQIAGEIAISIRTVKIHRGNVMRKMGTVSLADLVLIADSLGVRWRKRNASTEALFVSRLSREIIGKGGGQARIN